jgi:xylulokinase
VVPEPGEYVALGAARQAAWVLDPASEPPRWSAADEHTYVADPTPDVVEQYHESSGLTVGRD